MVPKKNWEFMTSMTLSVCSASFGITRFLKNGPMTLVPRSNYGASFLVALITVSISLIAKGIILGFLLAHSAYDNGLIYTADAIWYACCMLPQFVHVSTI